MVVRRRPGERLMILAGILGFLLAAFPVPGQAEEPAASTPGARPSRGAHRHSLERAPRPALVPESLARQLPRYPFPAAPAEVDEAATIAGRWAAEEVSRRLGRRIFYRAGFYDGTHLALEILPAFPGDYAEGLRDGARDPGGWSQGQIAGTTAAEEISGGEATLRVEEQFMDLSAEPIFDARGVVPPWRAMTPGIEPPSIGEVFREVAADHVPGLDPTWSDAFHAWRFDPSSLHECSGYADFLEERWADPEPAFDLWLEVPRRSAPYRNLDLPADKQRFKEVFRAAYASRLAMLYDEELVLSYEIGHGDGWSWGSVVVAEWRYRSGYAEGFNQASLTAAAAAYSALYPSAYQRHYEDQFRSWSRMSAPGIVSLRIGDGSDDGIFQPGEAVLAWLELANYGGAPGRWSAVISSDLIEEAAEVTLDVPARHVASPAGPIGLKLREELPRGRGSAITVTVGDLRRDAPLVVSYPLSLTGVVRLSGLDLGAGRAVAEVEVANRSRRPLSGNLALFQMTPLEATPEAARLDDLRPGETRSASFRLEGLEPLAALSGEVEMRFELTSGATRHDELRWSFPSLALDLESRELERFLVALAMDRSAPGPEVSAAIDLALERVAADWSAATVEEGNPYKHDYEERDSTTALGELVRAYQRERAHLVNREVFERLGGEIETMAESLPGSHPFLRKYLLRLARQLG